MKQSSSTTTSAIDEGRQYVFMSSELEGELDLGSGRKQTDTAWLVTLRVDGQQTQHLILSLEHAVGGGYDLQLQVGRSIDRFTALLLDSLELLVSIHDRIFKAKVLKLESDRAYLKLSR